MLEKLLFKRKTNEFHGKKKSIYSIRNDNLITFYASFIIKPNRTELQLEDRFVKRNFREDNQTQNTNTILALLNEISYLNISIVRMFLPANVRKRSKPVEMKKSASKNTLLEEFLEIEEKSTEVALSFYLVKVWKEYDLIEKFSSINDLLEEFIFGLKKELKQKLESLGKIGRILGNTLEEIVLYSSLNPNNFLGKDSKLFSPLTKKYSTIEKNTEFVQNFILGPSVNLYPESMFSFSTGSTSGNNEKNELFKQLITAIKKRSNND